MAVKQKMIECRDSPDEGQLNVIIRVLETIEQQSLASSELKKQCQRIVADLSNISMTTTPDEIIPFMQQVSRIQEVLVKSLSDNDMALETLEAFYEEISDQYKTPSPVMSIVLQLISPQQIPDAVKWMLQANYSEDRLKHAFRNLCSWLSKWTLTPNLGPLVLELMRGIEHEQHYYMLIGVALEFVEPLFKLIIIPDVRRSVGPVVLHMLSRMQHIPTAFHKIAPHVGNVLQQLHKEGSESSRLYLQNIVNLCSELIDHFPGYPINVKLRLTLQPFSTAHDYKKSLVDYISWTEQGSHAVPVLLSCSKVGLHNLGNTCYMNSVLQALFMTKPFRNEVLRSNRQAMLLFSKLQELFALLQFSERPVLIPADIATLARPPGFQEGHQHDSSEFLGYLLDVLHEQEGSVNQNGGGDIASSSVPLSNAMTVVQKSFGGRTLSLSECSICKSRSERIDTFRDLQLSFPSNTDDQSVQTLIEYYLEPEKLCGDNQYRCDTCESLTDGERITKIIEPPPQLVLTLKQFRYNPATQVRTKMQQYVKLDNDIDLENTRYVLYAAVVHCGASADSGHYYTYAKDGEDWYKFNDRSVHKSKPDELYGLQPPEAPYILFYSRTDCRDPEPVSKCELPPKLQKVLIEDAANMEQERRRPQLTFGPNRQNKHDDNPPPGCGGGGLIDPTQNRFVC